MSQLPLLSPTTPRVPDWCDLRCCDVAVLLDDLRERGVLVDCVIADPPWLYDQRAGSGSAAASDEYGCLPMADILDHLRAARHLAAIGSRLVLWTTWAMLPGIVEAGEHDGHDADIGGWRWVTGGSWCKRDADPSDASDRQGPPGMGYHARSSESEPWLILAGPGPHARADVPGCWVAATDGHHSSKPVALQAAMIRGWCPPGGLVLDLYAGLGSVARAVAVAGEGRRYIGAEIDPERHAAALSLLAQWRT